MTGTTARAHTEECRRRLEECLAEDEATIIWSDAAKLRVDESTRSGETESNTSSGTASSASSCSKQFSSS